MAQRRVDALGSHLRPRAAAGSGRGAGGAPLHQRLSQVPAGPPGPKVRLTDAERRQLYRDGFLILRGAIPRELTERARRRWYNAAAAERGAEHGVDSNLGGRAEFTELITKSCVAELLRNEMGPFSPPVGAQVAVTRPMKQDSAAELPPSDERPPWGEFGCPHLHVEGAWSGRVPKSQSELDLATGKPHDVKRYFGDESASVLGTDLGALGPLWMDREKTVSVGSFTAFAIVALNDQTVPGRGQTALLRGGHHAVTQFFRMQAARGGPLGPEGPGWPRLIPIGRDGVTVNAVPRAVRSAFADGAVRSGGIVWPRPTPCLMEEGDIAITLYAVPHSSSMNFGPDPRMNVIFRFRRFRPGDPNEGTRRQGCGVNDHPDRHVLGKFLDYPPGYDPFKISKEKLLDPWSEWQGMAQIVAEERAKEAAAHGAG